MSATPSAAAAPPVPVLRAAAWMLGSVGSFTAMAIAGRAVAPDLDTFELMLYRSLIGLGLVLVGAAALGSLRTITTRRLGLQVVRNLSHFTGQNLWFWALTAVPLAQLVALEFTQPIWVAILAVVVLGERMTVLRALVVAMGFAGALIVAGPGFGTVGPGVLAAAGAAVGFAGSAVVTRLLTRHVGVTCILFWLVAMQTLFGLVMAGLDGAIALPRAANLPWLGVLGAAGLVAHLCLTRALQIAPATVVIPFDFLRLPLLSAIGILAYGEAVGPGLIVGAAVILLANGLNLRAHAAK